MNDYRGKACIIDGKIVKKCIAQDFYSEKLYFTLTPEMSELDSEYCNVPSFAIDEWRVRILNEDEIANYVLYGGVAQ